MFGIIYVLGVVVGLIGVCLYLMKYGEEFDGASQVSFTLSVFLWPISVPIICLIFAFFYCLNKVLNLIYYGRL